MINRRRVLGLAAAGLAGMAWSPAARAEALTLRIAVQHSKGSPWGSLYESWAASVAKSSDSRLKLQFYYDGAQGEESDVYRKLQLGQLDGAALSCGTLGRIYGPLYGMALPGLFGSWTKLDEARNALKGDFEKGLQDKGFTVLGWGDAGEMRRFGAGGRVGREGAEAERAPGRRCWPPHGQAPGARAAR